MLQQRYSTDIRLKRGSTILRVAVSIKWSQDNFLLIKKREIYSTAHYSNNIREGTVIFSYSEALYTARCLRLDDLTTGRFDEAYCRPTIAISKTNINSNCDCGFDDHLSIFVKISSALPSPSDPSILYTPSTTLNIK